MALVVAGETSSTSTAPASADPVVANAVADISALQWNDTSSHGSGLALVDASDTNTGAAFELPNGLSGAAWLGGLLSGDFLIAADVGYSSDVDFNTNPLVEVIFGVAPGRLSGDIDNSEWHGVRIGGTTSNQVGAITVRHVKNAAAAGSAWTGSPVGYALKNVYNWPAMRIAIQRVGAVITTYVVHPSGTRVQLDSFSPAGLGDCDVFFRATTTRAGCTVQVHRLAVTGLAWVNGALTSST